MGFNIEDGTGKGNTVGVDATNRLLVRSINETIFQNSAEAGEAYFAGSPVINYGNANEVDVIYIKNDGDDPLILGNFLFMAETSNVTSPSFYTLSWYKNPTGISNGTAFSPLNQNFGSSKTLEGVFEYGDGTTTTALTGPVAQLSFPVEVFQNFEANLVLEKGSSFAITITPPATNTGMNFYFGTRLISYEEQY